MTTFEFAKAISEIHVVTRSVDNIVGKRDNFNETQLQYLRALLKLHPFA